MNAHVPQGPMQAPDEAVQQWEAVYQAYTAASQALGASPGDRRAAQAFTRLSWDLAQAWRVLAEVPGLPWWASAAVGTAVQACEAQAAQWRDRAGGR